MAPRESAGNRPVCVASDSSLGVADPRMRRNCGLRTMVRTADENRGLVSSPSETAWIKAASAIDSGRPRM